MAENLDSAVITNLDATPVLVPTTGEGAPGYETVQSDVVIPTASGGSVGSTYRLCRIPTSAKIKSVVVDLSGMDSNAAATETLDFNIAFSDSTDDGTPAALQGTIPQTGAAGTTTTVATYSNPNKLFGSAIALSNSGAAQHNLNITYSGSYTNWFQTGAELPLWDFFGFVNAQGQPQDPGGYFDLLVYVAHVAATAAAGVIRARINFVR